jgi:hypothetical protein
LNQQLLVHPMWSHRHIASCNGRHTILDQMEDVKDIKSLLTQVSSNKKKFNFNFLKSH